MSIIGLLIIGFAVFFVSAFAGIKYVNKYSAKEQAALEYQQKSVKDWQRFTEQDFLEKKQKKEAALARKIQHEQEAHCNKLRELESSSTRKIQQEQQEHLVRLQELKDETQGLQESIDIKFNQLLSLDNYFAKKEQLFQAMLTEKEQQFQNKLAEKEHLALKAINAKCDLKLHELKEINDTISTKQIVLNEMRSKLIDETRSNLTAIPYMAKIIADFDTRELEIIASSLDYGNSKSRTEKAVTIRELRRQVKEAITESKIAEYQLAYAIQMFPALEDFLETDYNDLPDLSLSDMNAEDHDATRDYLSKEEYAQLTPAERNQLALDRYFQSHRRTKWQVGRDYELYVGYKFSLDGYDIDYFGSYNGLEDLGRDLIAKKDYLTLIIQCKYWGSGKLIRENHINQLYGTAACYCHQNGLPQDQVRAVLVTNVTVSDTARKFADYLGVEVIDNLPVDRYPCIKCNINRSSDGRTTNIYHLPFDQQYDSCKINAPGEFFAMTVAEAEAAGFRRAYRWHSSEN